MARSIAAAVLAAGVGLLAVRGDASAQSATPYTLSPSGPAGEEEAPQAASPSGAVYIPGVGFRFLPPPGANLYRYRAVPPAYAYGDRESMRYYAYRGYRRACGHDRDRGHCARRWR
jgi:hypothetical protein